MGAARHEQPAPAPAEAPVAPTMRPADPSPRPARAEVWHAVNTEFRAPRQRRPWSRTRRYTVGGIVFLLLSVAGYFGFREYIYGDDAPPIPVVGELNS